VTNLLLNAQAELARRELARRSILDFARLLVPGTLPLDDGKLHLSPFQEHLAGVCQQIIDDTLAGKEPRYIIEAPPRHGKTLFLSQIMPPYFLLRDPTKFVMHATYSQDYANDLGRNVRRILNHPLYGDLNPMATPDPNTNAIDRIDLRAHGAYIAAGMGGPINGRGGNLCILDDPIKGTEQADSMAELEKQWRWYTQVFRLRAMPKCGIVIVLTRWTAADVAGRVIDMAMNDHHADQWTVIKYPALCTDPKTDPLKRQLEAPLDPGRYDLKKLTTVRSSISPRAWAAMYQQNPVPQTGTFFDLDRVEKQIKPVHKYPNTDELTIYIPGDFAIGEKRQNDYTVFWPFGVDADDNVWFLPDAKRFKGSGGTIVDTLLELAERYKTMELILEDGHIFRALHDSIKQRMTDRGHHFAITSPYPTQDKTARASPLRDRLEMGKVFLPDVPFVREIFMREAAAFGADKSGVHDDTIDAAALGLGQLTRLLSGRGRAPVAAKKDRGIPDFTNGMTMDEIQARLKANPTFSPILHTNPLIKVPDRMNGAERGKRTGLLRNPRDW
jgi:predicted phage terminase large subunit-like protein